MNLNFERIACTTASWFATPFSLAAVPLGCAAWLVAGRSVDDLTLLLSILAISTTQLVLVGQRRGEEAMQRKLDEMIHAIPGASDAIAGIEK